MAKALSAVCHLLALAMTPWAARAQPATQPAPAPASPAEQAEVDRVLAAMEQAGLAIRDVQVKVAVMSEDVNAGSVTQQSGYAKVRLGAKGTDGLRGPSRYRVTYERSVVGGDLVREPEHFAFDGEVLVQRKDRTRTVTLERLAKPGQRIDPLRLDGPMPLPFGEKADEVRKLFDVRLIPAGQLQKPPSLKEVEALVLRPRPRSSLAETVREVELALDPQSHLPVLVRVHYRDNQRKTAILRDPVVNAGLTDAELTVETPPGFTVIDNTPKP